MPLTASGHVLDAEAGDLALHLWYGFEDERSLEPDSRDDLESGRGGGSESTERRPRYWPTTPPRSWVASSSPSSAAT